MQDHKDESGQSGQFAQAPESRRWTRADWKLLGILLLVAGGIRVWQLTHTTVAARDSISFIRVAWRLHQHPLPEWPGELKKAEQHPAYPLAILAASNAVGPFHHGALADRMRLSAQLASALAAVLLVLPVFCLGRELFDRRVGFGTALLLQCVPVSGRILADGLSEALFLLFASSALLWSVRALRSPRAPGAFALTGLFGALAYLTRPEGAIIVAATGVVLLASQAVPLWRRSWRDLFGCGAALALAALLLAGPYVGMIGRLTVKPSAEKILKENATASSDADPASTGGGVLLAVFKVYNRPSHRVWWGLGVLGYEIAKGACYVGAAAALLGLWLDRRRLVYLPGAWMMLLVCLGVAYALWRVVVVVGYLSDRHTLLILLCGGPWCVAGLMAASEFLAVRLPGFALGHRGAFALPLLLALVTLPKTLQPLHLHRTGFREAGQWIAQHSLPFEHIDDALCWAHYYGDRVFLENTHWTVPPGYRTREFVVIEDAGNSHPRSLTYQLARKKVERARAAGIGPVHVWPVKRGRKKGTVAVYALPPATP